MTKTSLWLKLEKLDKNSQGCAINSYRGGHIIGTSVELFVLFQKRTPGFIPGGGGGRGGGGGELLDLNTLQHLRKFETGKKSFVWRLCPLFNGMVPV